VQCTDKVFEALRSLVAAPFGPVQRRKSRVTLRFSEVAVTP
jgi:hypothetical protein